MLATKTSSFNTESHYRSLSDTDATLPDQEKIGGGGIHGHNSPNVIIIHAGNHDGLRIQRPYAIDIDYR